MTHANDSHKMISSNPIILYDGVCGLCNRLTQFVLRHDHGHNHDHAHNDDKVAVFRFASLQSPFAATILKRHAANSQDLDTLYVVLNAGQPEERLVSRSDAMIFVLKQLGGTWRIWGQILTVIPRPLRDWGYRLIARNRYRLFGRFDTCPIPSQKHRERFIDL
jgi:predicted DCC family thiol-disulfide oxidoreductase YuxK